jgi:hypothetical protein
VTTHTPKTRSDLVSMLAAKKLTVEVVEAAVGIGVAESRTFSPGAPKSAPEITRWLRTVEAMHTGLMTLDMGWLRFDPENLPYFLQPELNLGLIVSSGNEFVGSTFGTPSNRNPKGTAFARRVDENGQVAMFGAPVGDGTEVDVEDAWVLLYNERAGQVHVELSCPIDVQGGFVKTWRDRIIFPAFDVANGRFEFEDEDKRDGDFGFTIERLG